MFNGHHCALCIFVVSQATSSGGDQTEQRPVDVTDSGGETQGTVNNFCSHRCGRSTRQIPIDPREWHLLGCQLQCGGDVYVMSELVDLPQAPTTVTSVATAIGRLTQHLAGSSATTWHQLVAEDHHMVACWISLSVIFIVDFFLCVC